MQINFVINIYLITSLAVEATVHRTIEQAINDRQQLIRKQIKILKKEEGAIRLVGGQVENEGNIEILHNGKWGAICDDEWDKNEATVVCRQLGYIDGYVKATQSGTFGPAKRKFWMDNVFCSGSEKELADCQFNGWGVNDCESVEAAGVICGENSEEKLVKTKSTIAPLKMQRTKIHHKHQMEIRLSGGRISSEGRVEIRIRHGNWGTICADGWSLLEANVVCQQLGFGYASDALQTDYFGGSSDSKIILSGTKCHGNETALSKCLFYDIEKPIYCHNSLHNYRNNHVAAVICTKYLPDLKFDHNELEYTAHIEDRPMFYLQCAMEENCVAPEAYEIQNNNPEWHLEKRRLLKFTARALNIGNTDFRPSIPKHLWEWHMCHMHFHSMEVFAVFDIFDFNNNKVAHGHKASFCLEDNQCMPGVIPKYACANYGDQGISVNCSDIYRYDIDCQWIDISEMDYGEYIMKVAINPEFKVAEMSFDNNEATCKFLYTPSTSRVYNCKLGRP